MPWPETVTAKVCQAPSSYIVQVRRFTMTAPRSRTTNCRAPPTSPRKTSLDGSSGFETLRRVIARLRLVVLQVARTVPVLSPLTADTCAERSVCVVPSYVLSIRWSSTGPAVCAASARPVETVIAAASTARLRMVRSS
ncbi:hypothetical protein AB0H06_29345 [Streptomyces althioticus]|uniref:hypothetical protein n=1 Tax=Streptomyces althioticus TaxID=83380 RepID=UPI0033CD0E0A